jgi:hypothetical protein
MNVLRGYRRMDMNRRWALVVLTSLCLLVPVIVAAQSTSAGRDPEAAAMLASSLRALTKGEPLRDVTLMGTARRIAGSDDETGQVTAKAMATGETRVDYQYPSGRHSDSRITSATGAVESWSGPDGSKHGVVPHNVAPLSSWFFPAALLQAWEQGTDVTARYAGRENRGGRDVAHVTITRQVPALHHPKVMLSLLQKAASVDLYLDPATNLPVAVAYNTHSDKNLAQDIPVEIRFSDYRMIEGVQVPYQIQKYLNHARVLDVQISSASINSGLTPSSFDIQ